MPLDKAGRIKRASEAGKVSGGKRTANVTERNKQIYNAYLYLVGATQSESDYQKAIEFLGEHDPSRIDLFAIPWPEPFAVLSKVTRLSRQQIYKITKASNSI